MKKIIVIFLLFCACNNVSESTLKKGIVHYAEDGTLSETEFYSLYNRIKSNSELKDTVKFDALVNETLRDKSVDIFSPIKKDKKPEVSEVKFYLETSASMGGYFKGTGEKNFTDIINTLAWGINGIYNEIQFSPKTIAAEIERYEDCRVFTDQLTNNKIIPSGHSPLNEIIKIIMSEINENEVSFFVTDGIMSGTNKQIKENPNYNIQNRIALKGHITHIVSNIVGTAEIGISMYSYYAPFNGHGDFPYYCYNNSKVKKVFNQRPFYVFLFGRPDFLIDFRGKFYSSSMTIPDEEIHMGVYNNIVSDCILYGNHIRERNCRVRSKMIEAREEPNSKPVKFAVGLNLTSLPEFVQNSNFLKENLKIIHDAKIDATITKVEDLDSFRNSIPTNSTKDELYDYSHYVELEISSMATNQSVINLVLDAQIETWYQEWSSDDDLNIDKGTKTTFNLKYLIEGIWEAYRDEEHKFVNAKIIIKK